jgi:hypothetical protein
VSPFQARIFSPSPVPMMAPQVPILEDDGIGSNTDKNFEPKHTAPEEPQEAEDAEDEDTEDEDTEGFEEQKGHGRRRHLFGGTDRRPDSVERDAVYNDEGRRVRSFKFYMENGLQRKKTMKTILETYTKFVFSNDKDRKGISFTDPDFRIYMKEKIGDEHFPQWEAAFPA